MTALASRRILVVEDDMLIAMSIEDLIRDAGGIVVGPAATVDKALALVAAEPLDAAVLDVNLGGRRADPVADALLVKRVPFVFLTGYGAAGVDPRHAGAPTLAKPFDSDALHDHIARLSLPDDAG